MKKVLIALAAAVLATAAFFIYSLATVELPEMGPDSIARSYTDVEPIQSQSENASAAGSGAAESPAPVTGLSFLNEEQRGVFEHAQSTVLFLADPSNLVFEDGNAAGGEIQLDEKSYLLITGQDENYDDFRNRMLGIFTQSCLEQLDFDQRFRSVDGKLAALMGGVGGAIDYAECPDAYRPESADETALTFTLIGHYIEQGTQETDTAFLTRRASGAFDSTQEFTIRLVNTENGWRVDEFHSPLYPGMF